MGKLIYSMIASLDGYIADEQGDFDWAVPSDEVHGFVNDLHRDVGTHLYGRRMYEVMASWQSMGVPDDPPVIRDFAEVWRAADKIVYSQSVESVATPRTRLARVFDPDAVRGLVAAAERDLTVGGAGLAAHALRAGLVAECHLIISPVVVGGGTPVFPPGLRLRLELRDERRFRNGMVYLKYAARGPGS